MWRAPCGRSQYSWAFKIIKIFSTVIGQPLKTRIFYSRRILIFNLELLFNFNKWILLFHNTFSKEFSSVKGVGLLFVNISGVHMLDKTFVCVLKMWVLFDNIFLKKRETQDGCLWWSFPEFKSIFHGRWKGMLQFCK